MSPITLGGGFPTFGRMARAIGRAVRKTARFAVIALLVLAVIHGIATVIQGRRVEARLKEIKARGEPVSLSEFGKPKIPDSENAAVVYARAFKALLVSPEAGSGYLDEFLSPSKRAADPKLWDRARRMVTVNSEALMLAEQAAQRPKCQFPINWEAGFATQFPEYMRLRSLSRLLCARAIISARDARMNEATRDIELLFKVSESLKEEPTLIGQLVRMAIVRQAVAGLREVMSTREIGEQQAARLDGILGDIRMGPGLTKAMEGERALNLWGFEWLGRNPLDILRMNEGNVAPSRPGVDAILLRYLWRPVFYGDELVTLRHMDRLVASSRLRYRETASEYAETDDQPEIPRWAILSRVFTPNFSKARMRADEVDAQVRQTSIALALQVYKGRHGLYPATLDELGRELPEDPFSGKPFVYRREGNGYLLYSVGGNLKDDKAEPVQWVSPSASPPPSPGGGPAGPVREPVVSDEARPGFIPSTPEPHYGDEPKYGDIIWSSAGNTRGELSN